MTDPPATRRLVLALATLALAASVAAPQGLVVVASPGLEATAREVRRLGEGDLSAVFEATGVAGISPPIRVLLVAEDEELARRTPEWISGMASGRDSTVVLFPARTRTYPENDLRSLLHHEVAHVLVARATRGAPVPRWFNEGVATVAARQWGLEDRARLTLAVIGRNPSSTGDLDRGFSGDRDDVIRSYALSSALVRSLRRRFGTDVTARILAAIPSSRTFDGAFRHATGESLAAVEAAFFGRQMLWAAWVPFLTSTTALWMGISLLALYAIRRRRERSAALRARWEREEGPEEVVN